MNIFLTEIRTFHSLNEIQEDIEGAITQFKELLEDYSEWLGALLRNPELLKDQEWKKKTAELQKMLKTGPKKENQKKGKGKKQSTSASWIRFKELLLGSDDFSEAEMLFEAIEDLREKISQLENVRESIEDLKGYGLGKEVRYIVYIKDGVPRRIFFKLLKETEASEKFEFTADFLVTR